MTELRHSDPNENIKT